MSQENIIYFSDYICITKGADGFYIESYKKGMSVDEFNKIIGRHPEIKITSFMAIKMQYSLRQNLRSNLVKLKTESVLSSQVMS